MVVKTPEDELDYFLSMLEHNAAMLTENFKKKEARSMTSLSKQLASCFSVSTIVPLQKPVESSSKPPCKVRPPEPLYYFHPWRNKFFK